MRHWLLILMMVLLPLRGWAGVAMAVSMTTPVSVGAAAHCAEHAAATETPSADVKAADGQTHTLCDVCNGPAMTASGQQPPAPAPLPQARMAPERVAFISAPPQRGHKPPIA